MPRNKDLKRLVRARMTKTGESYTTARSRIRSKPATERSAAIDLAAVAGHRDEVLVQRTGCNWERWVKELDRRGAMSLTHAELTGMIARYYKVEPWWTQAVAVGYERIKGLRERGQRLSGLFDASKSRTFPVSKDVLYRAWSSATSRSKWLHASGYAVRSARVGKVIRFNWNDGTSVEATFVEKSPSKCTVTVTHSKLPSGDDAARQKTFWSENLDRLAAFVA